MAQYTTPTGNSTPTCIDGDPGTGTHRYQVFQGSADGLLHMKVDSAPDLLTSFYSPTGHWNPAWTVELCGETGDLGSDMPGHSGAHVWLTNNAQYDSAEVSHYIGSLGSYLNAAYSPPYYNHIGTYSSTGGIPVDIWTSR